MTTIPMALSPLLKTELRFPDWGSGKHVAGPRMDADAIWNPCNAPRWHHLGHPIQQDYQLTLLKRSNVRLNDQLLPKPQESRMPDVAIDLPYPSDHPYLSHIPQKDILPNFDSPDDPQRGNDAKRNPPLHPTAARKNHDLTIVQKVKGFGFRDEIEKVKPESQKDGLLCNSDKNFFQLLKSPAGGQQIYYPIPSKLYATNSDNRPPGQKIGARTANALRNVERGQWLPTHTINYTGYGPANPMKLDNFHDKLLITKGETHAVDETLYPNSVPTFVPPRPVEGRVARYLAGRVMNQEPNYTNLQEINHPETETERQERWLLHDREYVNLPRPPYRDGKWKDLDFAANPGPRLEKVEEALKLKRSASLPCIAEESDRAKNYLPEMKDNMKREVQEMEARNRLKVLENSKPCGNIAALRRKLALATRLEKADVFYDHVGMYVGERGGLYRTSYDPYQLARSLERNDVKAEAQPNEPEGLYTRTTLNPTMDGTNKESAMYEKVASMSFPPHQPVMLDDFRDMKQINNIRLMPNDVNAAPLVQDGGFIETTTSLTSAYNFPKFLQEQTLGANMHADPSKAVSNENTNLASVKVGVAASPQTSPAEAAGAPATPRPPIPDAEEPAPVEIVSHSPVDINVGTHAPRIINLTAPDGEANRTTKDWRHTWRPGEGVPRPQSLIVNLQNAFRMSDVHRKFHNDFPENAPDLRDHIAYRAGEEARGKKQLGKKHQFGFFNAQALRGHTAVVPSFPC